MFLQVIVMSNGYHAEEIANLARLAGISVKNIPVDLKLLQDTMIESGEILGIVVVHCESFSGLVNPVNEIGDLAKRCNPSE